MSKLCIKDKTFRKVEKKAIVATMWMKLKSLYMMKSLTYIENNNFTYSR